MARKAEAARVTPRRVIADTGPLIALARIGRLAVLKRLFGQVSITCEVADELKLGSPAPGVAALEAAMADGWLIVLPARKSRSPHPLLDEGEASCLAAADARTLLLIDERLGRREAARLGLAVAGTAGILCQAKQRDHVKAVVPMLEAMRAEGYFLGEHVFAAARITAGE